MLYLAYGSNLLPLRLNQRVPSARPVTSLCLTRWALRFHKRGQDGSGKCDLVKTGDPGDRAYVAIFRMNPGHRTRLDLAEGLGNGYRLGRLKIPGLGTTLLYRASPSHIQEDLLPFGWYLELVREGAAFHGFPQSYLRALESVATQADPVTSRQRRHRALVHRSRRSRPAAR